MIKRIIKSQCSDVEIGDRRKGGGSDVQRSFTIIASKRWTLGQLEGRKPSDQLLPCRKQPH